MCLLMFTEEKNIYGLSQFSNNCPRIYCYEIHLYIESLCAFEMSVQPFVVEKIHFFFFLKYSEKNVIKSGILYDFSMSTIINTDNFHMIRF